MQDLEAVLPQAKRAEMRTRWMSRGGFYNPWLHLGTTSVLGVGAMAGAVWLLDSPGLVELAFGVALFVAANAVEWRIHKSLLHQRVGFAAELYDRHTPEHHVVFVTDDMAIREPREFKMVLLPAFGIVALFLGLVPTAALIWYRVPFALLDEHTSHNFASVFMLVTMGYVVTYEWLHLAYHLPERGLIGGSRLLRLLKRHHALHHDPRLMQRWNFNVSLPLWDLVRGTSTTDRDAVLRETPAS